MRIGIFDSGIGGLTTLVACLRYLPDEEYFFFADNANAPYGDRDPGQVREWTAKAYEYFLARSADAVVLACNSATSAAAATLREHSRKVPVIGIEPAIKKALSADDGRILLLATELTARGEKLQQLLQGLPGGMERVDVLACPGWMEIIERQDHQWREQAGKYWEQHIAGVMDTGIRGIVLGCTHYCWLAGDILRWTGSGCQVFDGNDGVARQLYRQVMGREAPEPGRIPARVRMHFCFSANAQEKKSLAVRLLASHGMKVEDADRETDPAPCLRLAP